MGFLLPFIGISIIVSLFSGGLPFLGIGLFAMPHFLIGFVLLFGVPLYNYLAYSNVEYAITSKRVIIQSGVVGRDFKSKSILTKSQTLR